MYMEMQAKLLCTHFGGTKNKIRAILGDMGFVGDLAHLFE